MATGDKPSIPEFHPPRRILLGPGPSPVDDRVSHDYVGDEQVNVEVA